MKHPKRKPSYIRPWREKSVWGASSATILGVRGWISFERDWVLLHISSPPLSAHQEAGGSNKVALIVKVFAPQLWHFNGLKCRPDSFKMSAARNPQTVHHFPLTKPQISALKECFLKTGGYGSASLGMKKMCPRGTCDRSFEANF